MATQDEIFLLLRDLGLKVDNNHLKTQELLEKFEESYSKRMEAVEAKLADHDRHFSLLRTVISWVFGASGLSLISAYFSGWFAPHK